jgi:hypothetical protein
MPQMTMRNDGKFEGFRGIHGPYQINGKASPNQPIIVGSETIGTYRRLCAVYQPFDGRQSAEHNARLFAASYDLALFAQKVATVDPEALNAADYMALVEGWKSEAAALLAQICQPSEEPSLHSRCSLRP